MFVGRHILGFEHDTISWKFGKCPSPFCSRDNANKHGMDKKRLATDIEIEQRCFYLVEFTDRNEVTRFAHGCVCVGVSVCVCWYACGVCAGGTFHKHFSRLLNYPMHLSPATFFFHDRNMIKLKLTFLQKETKEGVEIVQRFVKNKAMIIKNWRIRQMVTW